MSATGIATEMNLDLDELKDEVKRAAQELLEAARLEKGDIFVVGCSSSEIAHHRIGTFSSEEIGQSVVAALHEVLDPAGIYLAAQCCEHLNRAIIIEKRCAREYRLPIVNVVPQLKAGGSFATAAYNAC
ncbi:MAG: DUF436 family protein, partial [Lachnospira sp.]|nr:DUF436 family protein [Lachnospira sp.]